MDDERPVMVDVCSGIGGFALASMWAGFRPALFCEIDPYCRRVLAKHWPEVPCVPNLFTLTGDIVRHHLAFDYTDTSDVHDAAGARYGAGESGQSGAVRDEAWWSEPQRRDHVDLLTGGIPCQPFSVAGRQRGAADDRHLWPQMLRLTEELRPTFTVIENVPGFVRMALDDVCLDLEAAGYEVQPLVFPACGVGAWHRRERVFIVAHRAEPEQQGHTPGVRGERSGRTMPTGGESLRFPYGQAGAIVARSDGQDVPDAESAERERDGYAWAGRDGLSDGDHPWLRWDGRQPLDTIWQSEPPVDRLAHGVSRRVDQLRALGNAVVPQQAYPVLAAIRAAL